MQSTYLSWEKDQPAPVFLQSEYVSLESLLGPVLPSMINSDSNGPRLFLVYTGSLNQDEELGQLDNSNNSRVLKLR